jgi:hypothetical protein
MQGDLRCATDAMLSVVLRLAGPRIVLRDFTVDDEDAFADLADESP